MITTIGLPLTLARRQYQGKTPVYSGDSTLLVSVFVQKGQRTTQSGNAAFMFEVLQAVLLHAGLDDDEGDKDLNEAPTLTSR